jgi:hypothetical protein
MSEATEAAAGNRSRVVLWAVTGSLVAAVALWMFVVSPLLIDERATTAEALPPVDGAPADGDLIADPVATEPEVLGEAAADPLPETFEVFSARDPFQQLVNAPAATVEAASGDGSLEPLPGADGTVPVADGTDGTDGTGSTDGTPDAGEEEATGLPAATVGTTVIRIVDITTTEGITRVSLTVNGSGYDVAEGETFAERFRVLDISGSCATLLFGDSRFTLCKGDEIRK